jgi:Family of unknown function (DUF5906)/Primase C terminal 1 (PriCT-1)
LAVLGDDPEYGLEAGIQVVSSIEKPREAGSHKAMSAFVAHEAEPRWVEWCDDKGKKKPITPGTRRTADVSDPNTWRPFSDCRGSRYGIVFTGDGLGGVDLDGCRDPETGALTNWAKEVLDDFQTYAEISPSGTGVKLFAYHAPFLCEHVLPIPETPIGGKKPQIEAYATARYFAVTGNGLPEYPHEIRQTAEAWQRLAMRLSARRIRSGKSSIALSGRDGALYSLACRLRRRGQGEVEIVAALAAANHSGNAELHENFVTNGPLSDRDIARIVRSAMKHPPGDPGPDGELEWMNATYTVLTQEGSKFRIMVWRPSEVDPSRPEPVLLTRQDFLDGCSNQKFSRTVKDKTGEDQVEEVAIGPWWLANPGRREYRALRFEPLKGPEIEGYLNLWRGFGVTPAPGDWSLLRNHVLEVLAGGNDKYAAYIIMWMAWAVQNPDKPAGAALVFKGGEGTGKGTLARALLHGLHVLSQQHFTGRFNGQLHQCCLLFADEAFYAGDKKAEGVLKGLITEPTFLIERKGVDVVRVRNRLHVVMASNQDWVIPAAHDARRYAVFEVADNHANDKDWFRPMYDQLENGGYEAMLHDLQSMELGDWRPDHDIPQTEALEHQKQLSDEGAHWREILEEALEGALDREDPRWEGGVKILSTDARRLVTNDPLRWTQRLIQTFGAAMRELGFERKKLRDGRGRLSPPVWFYARGGAPFRKIVVDPFDRTTVLEQPSEEDAKVVSFKMTKPGY